MNLDALYSELTLKTNAKVALVVLDGVGDVATREQGYLTPLEAAVTPNLDALAKDSAQGRMIPVAPGITPGSGPGHLGLFGYDPLEFQVGRGVIEALGLGLELRAGDIAARVNFCTLDPKGIVTDRRAGRIDTKVCEELCALLAAKVKKVGDAEVIIKPGKGHRFVVLFRGKGLEGPLTDADPHREGFPVPTVAPVDPKSAKAKKAAKLVADFYKGLAQLVGMAKLEGPQTIAEQFERYLAEYDNFDYFFIHFKYTDMYGEDGNFAAKKKAVEELDAALPILLRKKPDVLAITSDHSTPCVMKGHSWHPEPVMIQSACSGSDKLQRFTETGANTGSLGIFEAKYLIRLMQANAKMFDKFGA